MQGRRQHLAGIQRRERGFPRPSANETKPERHERVPSISGFRKQTLPRALCVFKHALYTVSYERLRKASDNRGRHLSVSAVFCHCAERSRGAERTASYLDEYINGLRAELLRGDDTVFKASHHSCCFVVELRQLSITANGCRRMLTYVAKWESFHTNHLVLHTSFSICVLTVLTLNFECLSMYAHVYRVMLQVIFIGLYFSYFLEIVQPLLAF